MVAMVHGNSTVHEAAAKAISRLRSQIGRPDVDVCVRQDLLSACYRSTSKNGPEWERVVGRVSVETNTGRVLEQALVKDIPREQYHGKLVSGKTNLTTYLLHVPDRFGRDQPTINYPSAQVPDNLQT